MKRAALLILVVGAPLVLLLFPELRRRIAHKLRLLLLVWSGAVLLFGLAGVPGSERKSFLEGEWGLDRATIAPLGGVVLFAAAFASVLRDFVVSSLSKKSPGAAKRR